MRKELNALPIEGTVIIGEGAKDEAPELYCGEAIGLSRNRAKFDIAVDPVEGTSYTAKGIANALSVSRWRRAARCSTPARPITWKRSRCRKRRRA